MITGGTPISGNFHVIYVYIYIYIIYHDSDDDVDVNATAILSAQSNSFLGDQIFLGG